MIKNLNDSSEKKTSYIDTSNLRKLQSCLCGTNVVITPISEDSAISNDQQNFFQHALNKTEIW